MLPRCRHISGHSSISTWNDLRLRRSVLSPAQSDSGHLSFHLVIIQWSTHSYHVQCSCTLCQSLEFGKSSSLRSSQDSRACVEDNLYGLSTMRVFQPLPSRFSICHRSVVRWSFLWFPCQFLVLWLQVFGVCCNVGGVSHGTSPPLHASQRLVLQAGIHVVQVKNLRIHDQFL